MAFWLKTDGMGGLVDSPLRYEDALGMSADGESVRVGIGRPAVFLGGVAIRDEDGDAGLNDSASS